jgi:cytochrome c55X
MPWALYIALLVAFPAAAGQPTLERQVQLIDLVRQDCGSCHGLTLKGGLGPPLEPAALAGKDAEFLSYVILHGRRGTPMPPWREHLSEREAQWIAEQLKKGLSR